ncbi:hypothetical protein HYDPIDRAFT_23901 [Hydnomerulius pinastri MD-312]|nr:hypothetical protein HYDPIDRAFT_23901 [Hydnomerulius pinastri MD-312]
MSHSRASRDPSVVSQRTGYIPQPQGTLFPDGTVDEQVAEMLHEFVHPHSQEETTLLGAEDMDTSVIDEEEDEGHAEEVASWKRLPWWKRPSPYWIIFGVPIGSIGYSATFAPRVDMVARPTYS